MVVLPGEYVWMKYRHPGFAIADTVAKGNVRTWIAGKHYRYIPQQKSPRKDKSVGCPRGDGKSLGVTERYPWPVGWVQTGYPKVPGTLNRWFFGKFDPLMETFLECETMYRDPPPGHVFMESLAEIDPRKVAEVVHHLPPKKNNASVIHFFACSPKLMARFCWKRARLSLFRPQPHLPSFI